jgi:hypothetical protein
VEKYIKSLKCAYSLTQPFNLGTAGEERLLGHIHAYAMYQRDLYNHVQHKAVSAIAKELIKS